MRRRRRSGVALTSIVLTVAGIWGIRWWSHRSDPLDRGEPGLSVLLVTVDTLRADAVGAYSGRTGITPWIDRLATHGVRFANAHAHNVVTLPSHVNMLSGRYPQNHGVRDNAGFRVPPQLQTLTTLLKARGYRTGAFVSAFPLDSRFGLDRGFDVYDDSFVDATTRPAFLIQERAGTATVARARRWLDAQGDQPSFCWVHLYEPHFPYAADAAFASGFPDDPYLGEVAAVDAALQPLLQPVLDAAERGRTLVVLTSDHGESLGEHGEATHGIFAYEAALKVPLVLYQPRLLSPRVVAGPARHVDLLPTVLEMLSLPIPEGLAGASLLSTARGAPAAAVATYFEALSGTLNRGWAPLHGIIENGMKYVDLPVPELYELASDPGESRNLADRQPQQTTAMRALLSALSPSGEPMAARAEESIETRRRLQSLGYLSGTRPTRGRYTEQDDPKRLIGLDTLLQEVVGLYSAGDLAGALSRCRELVRRRPDMPVSLLHLAHLERESGNLSGAIDALRKAASANQEDAETLALLGGYLTEAGRAREAANLLEPYSRLEQPDPQVITARALALARTGQSDEALALIETARVKDPGNAMLLVHAGTVLAMAGDEKRASDAFETALTINPDVARAHSSLAVIAGQNGQTDLALDYWRRAVALDPQEHGKLLAFALALGRSGRTTEARQYLELFVASAPPALYTRDLDRVRAWLNGKSTTRP